jgi:hypothetical protein
VPYPHAGVPEAENRQHLMQRSGAVGKAGAAIATVHRIGAEARINNASSLLDL